MTARLFLTCFLLGSWNLNGQDILTNYEKHVNPATGDFTWGETVIELKSYDGSSLPVRLNYLGNVGTNQPASWVGLGWNLNMGEIRRELVGFPDDHQDYVQTDTEYQNGTAGTPEETRGYGPMYFNEFPYSQYDGSFSSAPYNTSSMDVLYSTFKRNQPPAISPAFDKFNLSSPFLGGTFSLTDYDSKKKNQFFTRFYMQGSTPQRSAKSPQADNFVNESYTFFQLEDDPLRTNYIEYYTNEDIRTNPTSLPHFVEYRDESGTALDRSSTHFYADDAIGAFTVVLSNGTKLHYSLPVLEISSKSISVAIDDNGNLDFNDLTRVIERSTPFAYCWKLTAITGADYVDANNSDSIDDGDEGLYYLFYYAKWYDSKEKTPYYDFTNGASPRENDPEGDRTFPYVGNVSITQRQNFYLDKIESDREVLIFYKSIRDDEFSDPATGSTEVPSLRLDRIIRYYKEGVSIDKDNAIPGVHSAFGSINTSLRDNAYLNGDFSSSYYNDRILGGIEFVCDYSLCGKYYKNIRNHAAASLTPHALPSGIPETINQVPTSLGNHGKLTLNRLELYQNQHAQLFDDYTFTYSTNDPDYDANDFDLTGNYFDVQDRRQLRVNDNHTASPANHADNWLLSTVQYPNNTQLEVRYQFDEYQQSIISGNLEGQAIPIKNLRVVGTSYNGMDLYTDLELGLFSDADKHLFAAHPGRRIRFIARFQGCNGSAEYVWTKGGFQYDDLGSPSSTSSLEILNTTITGKIRIRVAGNKPGSCNILTNTDLQIDYAHFTIDDRENTIAGTPRVEEIRIKENPSASSYYSLEYTYENGWATGRLSDTYINNDNQVSHGNANTSFNSLPFQIIYEKTRMTKKGLDQSVMNYSDTYFNLRPNPLSYRFGSYHGKGSSCTVNKGWLDMSVKDLWIMMHDDSGDQFSIPDLIKCAVETYVKNDLIPGRARLQASDYSDWQRIRHNLPEFNLVQLGVADPYTPVTSSKTIECAYRSSLNCNGEIVDRDSNGEFPYSTELDFQFGYFTSFAKVSDWTDLFGRIDRVETFDERGNLVLKTRYEYALKGTVVNNYYHTYGPHGSMNPSVDIISRLHTKFSKDYYYTKRKETITKGVKYLEEVTELEPSTGQPSKIRYLDEGRGILEETKTYVCADASYGHVWPWANTRIGFYPATGKSRGDLIEFQPNTWTGYSVSPYQSRVHSLEALSGTTRKLYGLEQGAQLSLDDLSGYSLLSTDQAIIDYTKSIYRKELHPTTNNFQFQAFTANNNAAFRSKAIETEKIYSSETVQKRTITAMLPDYTPIETYDEVKDSYTAHCYGLNDAYRLASAPNCRYGSFTVSSFEDQESATHSYFEGDVKGSNNRHLPTSSDIGEAHAGQYVCRINSSTGSQVSYSTTVRPNGPSLEPGRTYVASVWVNNQSYSGVPTLRVELNGSLNGGVSEYTNAWQANINSGTTVGDWTLIEVVFTVPATYTAENPNGSPISGTAYNELLIRFTGLSSGYCYFDDFRFHPADIPLSNVVYDRTHQRISHELDANNMATEIQYDEAGRILKKITETIYNRATSEQYLYND